MKQKLTALKNLYKTLFKAQIVYALRFFGAWLLQAHLFGVAGDRRRHGCASLRERLILADASGRCLVRPIFDRVAHITELKAWRLKSGWRATRSRDILLIFNMAHIS